MEYLIVVVIVLIALLVGLFIGSWIRAKMGNPSEMNRKRGK